MVVPLRSRGRTVGTLVLTATGAFDDRRPRVRAALRRPRRARARQRRPVRGARVARDGARHARRGGHDPGRAAAGWSTPTTRRPPRSASSPAEQLLATPPREIVDAYESFHEDGSPLRLEDLPGRQVLAGQAPSPLVVRAVDRRTGEERWRVVKATAVPGRGGRGRLAVNVIEDVTEVKRAELAQRFLAQASAVLASVARLRGDARPHRRARGAAAGRLVLGQPARRATGCARSRVAHVDPDKVALRARLPGALPDPAGRARRARRRCCATASRRSSTRSRTSCWSRRSPTRSSARPCGASAMRAVHDRADGHRRARDRRDQLRQRRVRAHVRAAPTSSSPRSSGGAPAPRSRTRGCTASARGSPRRSSAGCCPTSCRAIPGPAARVALPAGGRGEPRRRRLLRRVPDRRRAGCCWSATSPAAAPRRRRRPARPATRCARRARCSATRPRRSSSSTARSPTRRELTPCTVAIVHVTGADRGRAVRRPPAAAARPRRRRARRSGTTARCSAPGPTAAGAPEPVELEPGDVLVLYTDGVTDTRGAEERFGEDAAARGAAPARPTPRAPWRAIDRALSAFQRGAQADDTAVLALGRGPA